MKSGTRTTLRTPTHDERVLALLADGRPHTHLEIYALHVVAHSRISSLRKKGHTIRAWRDGDLYLYELTGSPLSESSALDAEPVVDDSLNGRTNDPRNSLRAVDEQPAVQLSLGLAA